MMSLRNISLYLLITVSCNASAQSFEKTFIGHWASTSWTYHFYKDNTYKWVTNGHFGNKTGEGRYTLLNDTINILNGYTGTGGTLNKTYILDKDSFLIDLSLRYDYRLVTGQRQQPYMSRKRNIKYPQINTTNQTEISDLAIVLDSAFNSTAARKYYHFDKFPGRKLLINNYYELKANIQVDSMKSIFRPKETLRDSFYIEIEDINLNKDKIDLDIFIHGEEVIIHFYYIKKGNEWENLKPFILELKR